MNNVRQIARTDADHALSVALDRMIRSAEVVAENESAASNADSIIEAKPQT